MRRRREPISLAPFIRREFSWGGSLPEINVVRAPIGHLCLVEASDRDAPALLHLMHDAFLEYEGLLDPPSAAHTETIDSVHKRLSAGSAVVATIADKPVGFTFYQPQGTHLYFSRLSVLPEFRNGGIGRALIEYVERRAQETGASGVRLGVRLQVPQLIARYERMGYRITKYMTHDGYTEPTYVYMEKLVAGSR
jgi:ribosomal protein S18 acetylase RimI-like enzyme